MITSVGNKSMDSTRYVSEILNEKFVFPDRFFEKKISLNMKFHGNTASRSRFIPY